MKKFLIFIVPLLMAFTLYAQNATIGVKSLKGGNGKTVDTITTGTKFLTAPAINGYQKVLTVQFVATKISGTIGGAAQLQGSIDGTNFYNIGSAFTLTDVAGQTASFKVTDVGDIYYRVAVTASGTMSARISGMILARVGQKDQL